jgi:pyrroloquinoline-quinone synthase
MNLIERLDEARSRWNVLDHPFYRRWEAGELTRTDLAFYAGEYRHAVTALADALDRDPAAGTRACTEAWRREDPLEARAVLYAIETGQPDISRTKLTGLVEHYGFEPSSPATAYFTLHVERDHEHAAESRAVLEDADPSEDDRLVAAAEAALEGNWRLLDACV